ncbi:MAG TPA: helix-hairpin-helix domain-containing protein [Xanthomonadaceae bacterium]|nr:helix-hairpin-helix domain-containing protein [Xanthomonadaceae bacterium]
MKMLKSLFLVLAMALAAPVLASEPVDVNTASAAEIATALNGVGLTKAEAIVAYREQHGPFRSADELINVRGIGLATVEKNRDMIRVSPDNNTAAKR